MSILVEATFEDGTLKPKQPLPLKEHQSVRITIEEQDVVQVGRAHATYGLLGWCGDAESIGRLAMDPEFGVEETP